VLLLQIADELLQSNEFRSHHQEDGVAVEFEQGFVWNEVMSRYLIAKEDVVYMYHKLLDRDIDAAA
jgi:hypothetical protein